MIENHCIQAGVDYTNQFLQEPPEGLEHLKIVMLSYKDRTRICSRHRGKSVRL